MAGRDADLVPVTRAANQAEAEFLQQLLAEEGIAAMVRRAPGFDVPDLLAGGPREIVVYRRDWQDARDALQVRPDTTSRLVAPRAILIGMLAVAVAGLLIVALLWR